MQGKRKRCEREEGMSEGQRRGCEKRRRERNGSMRRV